jgi:hypothetical protein
MEPGQWPIGPMAKTDAQDYHAQMSMFGLKAFRKQSVEVGQRYRACHSNFLGRAGDVWVVEDLFTASDAMPYAKLAAETDPSLSKTLSIAALIDRRRFLPA